MASARTFSISLALASAAVVFGSAGCHLLFAGYSNKTNAQGGAGGAGGAGATGGRGGAGATGGKGGAGATGGMGGGGGDAPQCSVANDCVVGNVAQACQFLGPGSSRCVPSERVASGFDADFGPLNLLDVAQHGGDTVMLIQQRDFDATGPWTFRLLKSNGVVVDVVDLATYASNTFSGNVSGRIAMESATRGVVVFTTDAPPDPVTTLWDPQGEGGFTVIGFDLGDSPVTSQPSYQGFCSGPCPPVTALVALEPIANQPIRYAFALGHEVWTMALMEGTTDVSVDGPAISCNEGARITLGQAFGAQPNGALTLTVQSPSPGGINCSTPMNPSTPAELGTTAHCRVDLTPPVTWNATCVAFDDGASPIAASQMATAPTSGATYLAMDPVATLKQVGGPTLATGLNDEDYVIMKVESGMVAWTSVLNVKSGCQWYDETRALAFDPVSGLVHFAGRFCASGGSVSVRTGNINTALINAASGTSDEPFVVSLSAATGAVARVASYPPTAGTMLYAGAPPILVPPEPTAISGALLAGSMSRSLDQGTFYGQTPITGYGFLLFLDNQ